MLFRLREILQRIRLPIHVVGSTPPERKSALPPRVVLPPPGGRRAPVCGEDALKFPGPKPYPHRGGLLIAEAVATNFLSWAMAQPQLAGRWITAEGLAPTLPHFCESLCWPCPAYVHFARELGRLTKKRREDLHRGGQRITRTLYWVPKPKMLAAAQGMKECA